MQIEKRKNKEMHLVEKFYGEYFIHKTLPIIARRNITPNQITILNMFFSIIILINAICKNYIFCAIGVQIYVMLDILDGSLARYKNLQSELGRKLDILCDFIFYNSFFICLGYGKIEGIIIFLPTILNLLYGYIATNYIGNRIRKMKTIKRFGIKKYVMDRGIILGMDVGTVAILVTIFLFMGKIKMLFYVIVLGYIIDIIYRVVEVKYNESLMKR